MIKMLMYILPPEEHPLIHPKQVHRNYHQQPFLHPYHSATVVQEKEVGSKA